jgi:parallel beta-helix repeat protein
MTPESADRAGISRSQESTNESHSTDIDSPIEHVKTGLGLCLNILVMAIAIALVLSVVLVGMPAQKARILGPDVPYIIYGYTFAENHCIFPSCTLKVLDRSSMNSSITASDSEGKYQFDLSSLPGGYQTGDVIWLLGNKTVEIGLNKTSVTGSGGKWVNLTLSAHTPIRIEGNSDFDAMHGVSGGSGTAIDPYVLENRDISGSGLGYCIYVGNTTDHFMVRNCQLRYASGDDWPPWTTRNGLTLFNASNGEIWNNTASSNLGNGIFLRYSNDTSISNNTVFSNSDGIVLQYSNDGLISNNSMYSNPVEISLEGSSNNEITDNVATSSAYTGIDLWTSSNNNLIARNTLTGGGNGIRSVSCQYNTISGNNASSGGYGIRMYSSSNNNVVIDNICTHNSQHGVYLQSSSGNTLTDNHCSYNMPHGIFLTQSSGNTLLNNTCSNNYQHGISLDYSSSNTISNNVCSDNYQGTALYFSSGSTLVNNTCPRNERGMYFHQSHNSIVLYNTCENNSFVGMILSGCSGCTVANNLMSNSTTYGLWIEYSTSHNNRIWNNTFYHNNGAGDTYDPAHRQAKDDGTGNWWNSTVGYGNWWSDWTRPDANGDGIVDFPYAFASSLDNYPLTNDLWACNYTLHLLHGWNFVSIPLADFVYRASTLGLAPGDVMCKWDSSSQKYSHSYIVGGPPPTDFEIGLGVGYWIYSAVEKNLTLLGYSPGKYSSYSFGLDVPSGGGWVCIGLTSLDEFRHASDIASYVSGAHAKFLCKYNATSDQYMSYVFGFSPPAFDFNVVPGDAMWMWVDAPGGTLSYSP